MKLNIGCGRNILEGWVNVDRRRGEGVDIVANLDAWGAKRPDEIEIEELEDNSADEFLLSHVLEHIHKPLPLMQELHRIAKPGAICTIRTPYGSSDDAWEDPTHVRPYFMNSFGYFSQPFYWRADYGYRGDWRVKKIILMVNKETARDWIGEAWLEGTIKRSRNVVTEMVAELEAVKPIREPKQELQDKLQVELAVVK